MNPRVVCHLSKKRQLLLNLNSLLNHKWPINGGILVEHRNAIFKLSEDKTACIAFVVDATAKGYI